MATIYRIVRWLVIIPTMMLALVASYIAFLSYDIRSTVSTASPGDMVEGCKNTYAWLSRTNRKMVSDPDSQRWIIATSYLYGDGSTSHHTAVRLSVYLALRFFWNNEERMRAVSRICGPAPKQ